MSRPRNQRPQEDTFVDTLLSYAGYIILLICLGVALSVIF